MYLALVDETGRAIPPPPSGHLAAGRNLAAALERYRAAMAPNQRDGDHSVYISVMQAVSFRDFDASRLVHPPHSDTGSDVGVGSDADDLPIRPHGPRDQEPAL